MKILIATLGSLGDLHPFLALGAKLSERGHEVTIATNSLHRERVEALNLGWRRIRPEIPEGDPQLFAKLFDTHTGPEYAFRSILGPALRESYDDLIVATEGIDFLLSTPLSLAAPLVAEKKCLLWASAQLQPIGFLSKYDPPLPPAFLFLKKIPGLAPLLGGPARALARYVTRTWAQTVYDLRKELGLEQGGHPIWEGQYAPQLILGMFSSQLMPKQPDWPLQLAITGFCYFDHLNTGRFRSEALVRFLADGTPPIVVTFGSAAVNVAQKFYADAYEAIRRLRYRAIFLTGNSTNRASLPDILPPQYFASEYLPYREVFPHAAAILHQGGIGTLAQSLRFGKPMVILPFSYDQPDNAFRAEQQKIAVSVERKQANAQTLYRALHRVLGNAEYTKNAKHISEHLLTENGPLTAALALEKLYYSQSNPLSTSPKIQSTY